MSAKANAFANLAGGALSALLYFVSTPLYLQALGGQAFGLLGVYATIFGVSMLLDMGLTPALTRELAKLSAEANSAATTRNTVRTLELIYFAISVIALIILYPLAPLLGEYWLNTQSLPKETVDQSLQWMVILLVLQLPIAFYNGGPILISAAFPYRPTVSPDIICG